MRVPIVIISMAISFCLYSKGSGLPKKLDLKERRMRSSLLFFGKEPNVIHKQVCLKWNVEKMECEVKGAKRSMTNQEARKMGMVVIQLDYLHELLSNSAN